MKKVKIKIIIMMMMMMMWSIIKQLVRNGLAINNMKIILWN